MNRATRLLGFLMTAVLLPAASFGQSQDAALSSYRFAVVATQTFSNGKVDPYGLAKRLRERLGADPSWQVLADVSVTPKAVAFSWPSELPWQKLAASEFISNDRVKLAQTALFSIATPGGRGRIEVYVVVSDIFGRELARFEGISGVFGPNPGSKMLNALDKAIVLLSRARPQFVARTPMIERVVMDEEQARTYFASALTLSPIEGIWSDRDATFRMAIKRDEQAKQFVAVILSTKHPFWESGMVKGRFELTSDPANVQAQYFLDDHREQRSAFRLSGDFLTALGGVAIRLQREDTGVARAAEGLPPVAQTPQPAPPPTRSADAQPDSLQRIGTGSAFAVGGDLVATNFHVIDGGKAWELRFPGTNQPLPLELVVADKANDLAIMRVTGLSSPLTSLHVVGARMARLGEDVYSVGFPLTGVLGDGHKVTTGVLSGLAGLENDPRFFQLTVPVQPGNSGGPVFNSSGDVVGILASTLSVDYLYKAAQAIPQNVNFAIKSDYLLLLLAQIDTANAATRFVPSASQRVDQIANVLPSIGLISTLGARDDRTRALPTQSVGANARRPREFPDLQVAYRHPTGPQLLIRQRDEPATITFYRADASIYGHGSGTWDPGVGGFAGFAEIPYVCGSIDTRVTTVKSELQLFLESDDTLRLRLQIARTINCDRNQVQFYWGEDKWYPK